MDNVVNQRSRSNVLHGIAYRVKTYGACNGNEARRTAMESGSVNRKDPTYSPYFLSLIDVAIAYAGPVYRQCSVHIPQVWCFTGGIP